MKSYYLNHAFVSFYGLFAILLQILGTDQDVLLNIALLAPISTR